MSGENRARRLTEGDGITECFYVQAVLEFLNLPWVGVYKLNLSSIVLSHRVYLVKSIMDKAYLVVWCHIQRRNKPLWRRHANNWSHIVS